MKQQSNSSLGRSACICISFVIAIFVMAATAAIPLAHQTSPGGENTVAAAADGIVSLIAPVSYATEAKAGEASKTKPAVPKLKSVKSKKLKTITVTWEPVENADGYVVWYRPLEKSSKKSSSKAGKTTGETVTVEETAADQDAEITMDAVEATPAEAVTEADMDITMEAAADGSAGKKVIFKKTIMGGDRTKTTLSHLLGGRDYKVRIRSFRIVSAATSGKKLAGKASDSDADTEAALSKGKSTAGSDADNDVSSGDADAKGGTDADTDNEKNARLAKSKSKSSAGSNEENGEPTSVDKAKNKGTSTSAGENQDAKKIYSKWTKCKTATVAHDKWSDLKDKYAAKKIVKQIIFVKYLGDSKAKLYVYKKKKIKDDTVTVKNKDANAADAPVYMWKKVLSCDAFTGQNGIDKKKEGDRRTPTGVYTLTHAFGVLKDPGSKMDYVKLNKYLWWCGDRDHYNQMIDIRDYPHSCRGEHLIDYTKQYAYSMALNYNSKNVYGKGSAIFLHCFGYNPYTLGCIAVSEENMKTILKTCGNHTKICIYRK